MDLTTFWSEKHQRDTDQDWANKPSLFIQWAKQYFPSGRKALELGAGTGQDTRFLAEQGFEVTSTDFSETALKISSDKTSAKLKSNISFLHLDLKEVFPFPQDYFNLVYSHLSVHYFDQKTTQQIFDEIYRVLKPGGIVAIIVNSKSDPEFKLGLQMAEGLTQTNSIIKRFFNVETMKSFVGKFHIIVLDDHGTTYKDSEKGVFNLILFIGQKS